MVTNQQRVREFITTLGVIFFASVIAKGGEPPPLIDFDVRDVISCREIGSSKGKPRKLIEVVFVISAELVSGSMKQLKDMKYTVSSESPGSTIKHFVPTTELYTDVLGPIRITTGGTLSGKYKRGDGAVEGTIQSTVQTNRLPPKKVFIVSGFRERGHAVRYKLKPTTLHTLEGNREFGVTFFVPSGWTGDWVEVQCVATGVKLSFFGLKRREVASGLSRFAVGLHLEGDEGARKDALNLQRKRQRLLDYLVEEAKKKARKAKDAELRNMPWWQKLSNDLSAFIHGKERVEILGMISHRAEYVLEGVRDIDQPVTLKSLRSEIDEAKQRLRMRSGANE